MPLQEFQSHKAYTLFWVRGDSVEEPSSFYRSGSMTAHASKASYGEWLICVAKMHALIGEFLFNFGSACRDESRVVTCDSPGKFVGTQSIPHFHSA